MIVRAPLSHVPENAPKFVVGLMLTSFGTLRAGEGADADHRRGVPVQCTPGRSGGIRDADAAALLGFTVVHPHGGLTAAPYDGWTENIFAPGQNAVSDYTMQHRAALLWYHDHVMG
jgi:o-aminophenol oxidase